MKNAIALGILIALLLCGCSRQRGVNIESKHDNEIAFLGTVFTRDYSIEEISHRLGISRQVVNQAKNVH